MLTATITKKTVTTSQKDLYAITINLSLKDGVTEVLNKDYTDKYRTGQNISAIVAKFIKTINLDIVDYKAAKVIFDAAGFNTAITNIQNGLTL